MTGPVPQDERARLRREAQQMIADILKRKKVQIKLEDIKEGVSLTRDLNIDSLDILQLVTEAEKQYKLKIPDSEVKSLDDLGRIVDVLMKHLPRKP